MTVPAPSPAVPVPGEDRLAAWAMEVTDPAPDRDLGELADWAADVTDHRGATA